MFNGKGEEWFGNVLLVKSGVVMIAKVNGKGVSLLPKQLWQCVKECKEVSSRLMRVTMKVDCKRWEKQVF